MEQHPLYRLYVQLNERVDKLSSQSPEFASANSPDLSDIIVRLKELEAKPSVDGVLHQLSVSIENLKNENAELKKQLELLNKIDNLEARVYNLEVEPKVNVEPLNNRLINLENNNYNEQLTELSNRLNPMEQYVNSITDLSYRLGEVEKRPELSQRLSAVETIISNIQQT
jgi:DNA repair ATPase RecN